jgi:hypothetical protein
MLFALLEVDPTGSFLRGSAELEDRYNALCHPDMHQPFKRVINELTEAFVKKSPGMFAEEINWIHPSCRDLAIDELSENARERRHFLANCSMTGLSIAASFAGGAEGVRQLPLLQTKSDWEEFTARAEQLTAQDTSVLFRLWQNYLALKKELGGRPSIAKALPHLLAVIKRLLHFAREQVENAPYSQSMSLEMFFEMCKTLQLTPEVNLNQVWLDCREDVKEWVENADDPWEDAAVPERVSKFMKVLNKFAPAFLQEPGVEKQLNEILDSILERAEADTNVIYSSTSDENELTRRAAGFDQLHKSFGELAALPLWTERQEESLKDYATHFHSEAEAVREDIPWDPDYDDSQHVSEASDEVNVADLFRDL